MSRHFRSAYSVAQVAVAGPSRVIGQSAFRPPTQISRRTLFEKLPSWLRIRKDEEKQRAKEAKEAKEAEAKSGETKTIEADLVKVEESGIYAPLSEALSGKDGEAPMVADLLPEEADKPLKVVASRQKGPPRHTYTSAKHKISPKKLEMLAHQIQGLPIDEAILQMQFSLKGAAKWIKPNLVMARDHAIMFKHFKRERLFVAEAIVNKESFGPKQMDIKGRGRYGIKRHPYCRLKIVLREGRTMEEKVAIRFTKDVNKHARSAGLVREDQKIRRKTPSAWAW